MVAGHTGVTAHGVHRVGAHRRDVGEGRRPSCLRPAGRFAERLTDALRRNELRSGEPAPDQEAPPITEAHGALGLRHPLRNAVAGAVAGAIGTAAMDYLLYRRCRRDGGEETFWHWESAAGVTSWDE